MNRADPWDETEALERKMEVEILEAIESADDQGERAGASVSPTPPVRGRPPTPSRVSHLK